MSREVRRVPLDWKHPVEPDPRWPDNIAWRIWHGSPPPRLHDEQDRLIGLMDDYPGALEDWQNEGVELQARTGHHWEFSVEYHLTGKVCPRDEWRERLHGADYEYHHHDDAQAHPWVIYDGDDVNEIVVRDEDHLFDLVWAEHMSEEPDPKHYMPVWPEGTTLGWCLYETVSEGTPVTPVFATAEELIDHLATVGQDWDQVPMRRTAAEALVRAGGSLGSMLVLNGEVFRSDADADLVQAALAVENAVDADD